MCGDYEIVDRRSQFLREYEAYCRRADAARKIHDTILECYGSDIPWAVAFLRARDIDKIVNSAEAKLLGEFYRTE